MFDLCFETCSITSLIQNNYATQKQNIYLLDHNVRQNASEVHFGSATQKEEASDNKQKQQGHDTDDVSDECYFYGKYVKI